MNLNSFVICSQKMDFGIFKIHIRIPDYKIKNAQL